MIPGKVVEVELPGLDQTVLLIAGAEEGKLLAAQGVPRGRIWTAREVRVLLSRAADRQHALNIAEMKLVFNGRIDDALNAKA